MNLVKRIVTTFLIWRKEPTGRNRELLCKKKTAPFNKTYIGGKRERRAVFSCTGAQGNNHCIFFVKESLVSCNVLFGLLYRL